MNFKINWDALGIAASLACAIHCAILPLIMTSLPVFGINIIDNMSFEYLMILLAFLIGVNALSHGYRKHHHQILPILIFVFGIILLIAKQLWHEWQLYFLVPAVAAVVFAHFYNYRLCRKANHCHASDCNH
ncbi:MerC domain-containing protein [Flavihumibacter rivuli]|uniref:MerC domain-containing protein n=1 Tax=Flavihumibacter rivuli TaxID=2838156 RepID=UPI001BDE3C35|nr:MerC domain-containing protein [Flavihumibacter rivuli]ULQ55598.1 MerC domain-containing protein [Flavihumibacter rivuli]